MGHGQRDTCSDGKMLERCSFWCPCPFLSSAQVCSGPVPRSVLVQCPGPFWSSTQVRSCPVSRSVLVQYQVRSCPVPGPFWSSTQVRSCPVPRSVLVQCPGPFWSSTRSVLVQCPGPFLSSTRSVLVQCYCPFNGIAPSRPVPWPVQLAQSPRIIAFDFSHVCWNSNRKSKVETMKGPKPDARSLGGGGWWEGGFSFRVIALFRVSVLRTDDNNCFTIRDFHNLELYSLFNI